MKIKRGFWKTKDAFMKIKRGFWGTKDAFMKIKRGFWGTLLFVALLVGIAVGMVIVLARPASVAESVRFPIIMYHDVRATPEVEDDYLISTRRLEEDITAMLQAGYQPVSLSRVIAFVYNGEAIPDKPVLLVFDDGYKSMLEDVLPLLQRHEISAVVSLIGGRADGTADGTELWNYLTWDGVRELVQSGHVEVQSHTAALHVYRARKGVSRLPYEELAGYESILAEDIDAFRALIEREGVPMLPSFAYPYGFVDADAEALLRRKGFAVTMTSEEHVNFLTRNPECLYLLGRLNRSAEMTTKQLMVWLDGAETDETGFVLLE